MAQITDRLAESELFSGLNQDQLIVLADASRKWELRSGEPLIEEDEQGYCVYLIIEGRVDVTISIPNSNQGEMIATLKEGDVVGELALVGRALRSANVIAKTDLQLIAWNTDELLKILESDLPIGYRVMFNLAKLMAGRLTSANLVIRNLAPSGSHELNIHDDAS